MKRREFVLGLTAATAFAGAAPPAAAAEGRRVALVIGNGAYRNVPALLNPPNDASDRRVKRTRASPRGQRPAGRHCRR